MKKLSKKDLRMFFIGLVSGILIWFIIDLLTDWDGHVRDFNRGQEAAKELFQSR